MQEKKINQLIEVLEAFRELNPDINANMILTFLEVAKDHGVNGRDLEATFDFKHATAARLLRYFDVIQSAGKPGLGLFECRLDPHDYKSRLRYLNDDGKALLEKIDALLAGR